ncbi:TPA: hypothetical protein UMU63_002762 [Stenotrophomonas maltophilia]|nr:hypothetical protein [Stenotrophomonas maltophilia]HEL3737814.1 hypothetical protein [Stenotrophomonas maltophilia]
MQEALKQKHKLRLLVLHKLYELSGSDVHKFVNGGALFHACGGGDEAVFKSAVDYLEGQGLVEVKRVMMGLPGMLRIKHKGIVEVEGAFAKPDEATSHFMPVNMLYVNQMIGSAIQQGTSSSVQTLTSKVDIGESESLAKFVEFATNILESNKSDSDLWRELKSEVETLRAQSNSPNPKRSIIKDGLSSLGRLCEGAASGAIGAQLATYIPPLLAIFG